MVVAFPHSPQALNALELLHRKIQMGARKCVLGVVAGNGLTRQCIIVEEISQIFPSMLREDVVSCTNSSIQNFPGVQSLRVESQSVQQNHRHQRSLVVVGRRVAES